METSSEDKGDASKAISFSDDPALNQYEGNYLFKIVDKSVEMETNRYNSLIQQTTMLLTSISILSIAIVTAGAYAFDSGLQTSLVILIALALMCLIFGIITCVVSQFRVKYKVLNPPETLYKERDEKQRTGIPYYIARDYAQSLQAHYESIKSKNDFILVANKVATGFMFVALALAFVSVIVYCVGYPG